MKKIFTLVAVMMAGMCAWAAPIEGTGELTYQLDMNMGMEDQPDLLDPETIAVEASYEEGVLTLLEMPDDFNPISFVINLATGEAIAANQVAYTEEDDDPDYNFTYYYSDVESQEAIVIGNICNNGANSSVLTINPFGTGFYFEAWDMFFFLTAYYNTEVVLDFAIPGLEAEGDLPVLKIESIEDEQVNSDAGAYISFTVEVTAENVPEEDLDEVEVYYTHPMFPGEVYEAERLDDGNYSFIISSVEFNKEYTISVYAKYGNVVSETMEYTFTLQSSGINSIESGNEASRYYNLNGVEVKNPQQGVPYIKVNGNKAEKVIIR